jgi:hypothetical protein
MNIKLDLHLVMKLFINILTNIVIIHFVFKESIGVTVDGH